MTAQPEPGSVLDFALDNTVLSPAVVAAARADLAAMRARLANAEAVIADALHVGGAGSYYWVSLSRHAKERRAVFHASLDAYAKTYLSAPTVPNPE